MKKKITATVLSQKEIAPRIFDMWIATDLAEQAKAGQFIGVYPKDRSTLLPRPISICQVSDKKDALRIVYRIAGQGTAEFSSYTEGDSVEILGTLGNGFPTEAAEGKKVFLMGGGIGIPPMLEINVSCPNVKEGAIAFGQKADALYNITSELKNHAKQPIIMKLSPNVTDITEMAKAAEAAGADALSLINTITGMKIDIHRRKFAIANKTGGMSGPAIKPIAVRMVYQVAQAVQIPIIGMGGIATAEDAIEFILAGASAVSVGAMNFVDPYTTVKVVEGIEDYMRTYHVENLTDLIGAVQ